MSENLDETVQKLKAQQEADNKRTRHKLRAWGRTGTGKNLWEESLDRARHIYDSFDHVAVAFSGGKDSMTTMEVMIEVARERDRLPLTVVFVDEELIAPYTVEYVDRVHKREDIDLVWLALPHKHRASFASNEAGSVYPWAPEADMWARQPPEYALTLEDVTAWYKDPMGLDGTRNGNPEARVSPQDLLEAYLQHKHPTGSIAVAIGLRAQESLVRLNAIAWDKPDHYMTRVNNRLTKVYPVYDWTVEDIWTAAAQFGWDYNQHYDMLEMVGVPPVEQRAGQPYGAESMRVIDQWVEIYPEFWDAMTDRYPELATVKMYGKTELYAYKIKTEKPDGYTWPEYLKSIVEQDESPTNRAAKFKTIDKMIKAHYRKTRDPILVEAHPSTGLSWQVLLRVAHLGDGKGRVNSQKMQGSPEKYAQALHEYRQELRNGTTDR